ncbi:Fur family transcriptional regulator [Rubellicoccus peritrichatus]|uniref:Transcriptional repressor n=1 Tax=Rubellicoccus peritrichatus TaxID=3080537 RepID=A0AAQ3L7J8_9BACT|nr:transcriptional repressor [Puniceicoccus sp. CR14]WOO40107.1 transcriptional repressor [Puniceicoccus sp. CR14]
MILTDTDDLIKRCRDAGMRSTKLLRAALELLSQTDSPVSIQQCTEMSEELGACDQVTIYRLFERLEKVGIARRIGLHERAAHFILTDSFHHRHFVCCTSCGSVRALTDHCTLGHMEEHIAEETGYQKLYHELVFYGVCPKCSDAA